MKASISSIWLVGLVVTFIMIFSAYIIITVDYSATFKMKNEVLTIIEKNKGLTVKSGNQKTSVVKPSEKVMMDVGSLRTINAFLAAHNYNAKGPCAKDDNNHKWYGIKSLKYDTASIGALVDTNATPDKLFYYCVARFDTGRSSREVHKSVYYQVQLFYKFEIPVLRELLPVRVDGTTDEIYVPSNDCILEGAENKDLYGTWSG